jgi:hypothetical protein
MLRHNLSIMRDRPIGRYMYRLHSRSVRPTRLPEGRTKIRLPTGSGSARRTAEQTSRPQAVAEELANPAKSVAVIQASGSGARQHGPIYPSIPVSRTRRQQHRPPIIADPWRCPTFRRRRRRLRAAECPGDQSRREPEPDGQEANIRRLSGSSRSTPVMGWNARRKAPTLSPWTTHPTAQARAPHPRRPADPRRERGRNRRRDLGGRRRDHARIGRDHRTDGRRTGGNTTA